MEINDIENLGKMVWLIELRMPPLKNFFVVVLVSTKKENVIDVRKER